MLDLRRLASGLRDKLAARAFGPIGLELGADSTQLVQLEQRSGALRIAAECSFASAGASLSEAPAELERRLRDSVRRGGFRGRRVVTLLPDPGARLMVVNYACDDDAAEPQQILGLAAERSDDPIGECVVDFLRIRSSDEHTKERSALVAVARRDAVVEYLELLRRAGLRVDALEIAPLAIHRLTAWLSREDRSSHAVVLYGGRRRSHLTVFSGRRLLLYRELDFGEDAAVETLSKALDMSTQEATTLLHRYGVWPDDRGQEAVDDVAEVVEVSETLRQILKPGVHGVADEIRRAGVYIASQWRGASLDRVWLLGSFARWPRVERLLESLASVPTRSLDAGLALRAEQAPPGELALAAGLAMRGLADG